MWEELPPEGTFLDPMALQHLRLLGVEVQSFPLERGVQGPVRLGPGQVSGQGGVPGGVGKWRLGKSKFSIGSETGVGMLTRSIGSGAFVGRAKQDEIK